MGSGAKFAGVFILGMTLAVHCLAQDAGAAGWTDISSLSALPAGVQKHLGVGLEDGANAISDRGGAFNASDVGQPGVPHVRFVQAFASGDRLLVVVEVGGWGYHYTVHEFSRADGKWDEARPHPEAWPESLHHLSGPLVPFLKVPTK